MVQFYDLFRKPVNQRCPPCIYLLNLPKQHALFERKLLKVNTIDLVYLPNSPSQLRFIVWGNHSAAAYIEVTFDFTSA